MMNKPVPIPKNSNDKTPEKLLGEWYTMAADLKKLRASEMLLRKEIFNKCFPNPKEGTNSFALADGYILKAVHTITRDVDEGAFNTLKPKLEELKINCDSIVRMKPSLAKTVYNTLSVDQKFLFDQALTIKPGSPALSVVMPKAKK